MPEEVGSGDQHVVEGVQEDSKLATVSVRVVATAAPVVFSLAYLAAYGLGLSARNALGVASALMLVAPLCIAAAVWLRHAKYNPRTFWKRMSALSFSVLVLNLLGHNIVLRGEFRAFGSSLLIDVAERTTGFGVSLALFCLVGLFSGIAIYADRPGAVALGGRITPRVRELVAAGFTIVAATLIIVPTLMVALGLFS